MGLAPPIAQQTTAPIEAYTEQARPAPPATHYPLAAPKTLFIPSILTEPDTHSRVPLTKPPPAIAPRAAESPIVTVPLTASIVTS